MYINMKCMRKGLSNAVNFTFLFTLQQESMMALDPWRSNLLDKNLQHLCEKINFTDTFWDVLISRDVVTSSERDQIQVKI